MRYVNGGRDEVPIQNGFFVAVVEPVRTLNLSDHPHELVGYEEKGQVVDSENLDQFFDLGPVGMDRPAVADVTRGRAATSVPIAGGSAVLYLSPSRLGGHCARLATGDTTWSWSLPTRPSCARRSACSSPASPTTRRPALPSSSTASPDPTPTSSSATPTARATSSR